MSMEGTVLVTITGGQGEITNTYEGQCYDKNGHHYVLFQEELTEDGGRDRVAFSSRLKIEENQVTLRRNAVSGEGAANKTVMEFIYREQAKGERGCMVDYPSPYGLMQLEIRTKKLRIAKEDGEIRVHVFYHMLQNGQEISRDELKIWIKK